MDGSQWLSTSSLVSVVSVVPVVERDSLLELKYRGGENCPGQTCLWLLGYLIIITTRGSLSSDEVAHQITITVSSQSFMSWHYTGVLIIVRSLVAVVVLRYEVFLASPSANWYRSQWRQSVSQSVRFYCRLSRLSWYFLTKTSFEHLSLSFVIIKTTNAELKENYFPNFITDFVIICERDLQSLARAGRGRFSKTLSLSYLWNICQVLVSCNHQEAHHNF